MSMSFVFFLYKCLLCLLSPDMMFLFLGQIILININAPLMFFTCRDMKLLLLQALLELILMLHIFVDIFLMCHMHIND